VNQPGRAGRTAVLVSALIALATLWVNEAAARAAASLAEGGQDVIVQAAAGIGQVVKADRWAPILVSLDSSLPTFTGELLVSWGDVHLRRVIALPSPGRRQLELYLRTPDPDGTIRVRLVSGNRELQSLDLPVRIVAPAEPVAICVDAGDARQDECSVRATAESLPRSVRGYDVGDRIVWTDAGERLTTEQRTAIQQHEALHSLNASGDTGLVRRPSRPERRRGLPVGTMEGTGTIVFLYLAGLAGAGIVLARRRTSVHWVWVSALAIVTTATAVAQGVGRIGPGTAIAVYHSALLEQIPGTGVSVLSMRALAEFPSHDAFVLSLPVSDGTIEPSPSARQPSEQLLDVTGQPMIAGVFGLGSRQAFTAEAIVDMQPLTVARHGDTWTVTNHSALALERCHFAEGFSTTQSGAMAPGATLTARATGEMFGPVFTCEASSPLLDMRSPDHTVDMRGITVIAVYASRPPATTSGADD
jgi:hypothetical protein